MAGRRRPGKQRLALLACVMSAALAVPQVAQASAGRPNTAAVDDSVTARPTTFHTIGPTRFLDTRDGTGASGPVGANGTLTVPLQPQTFPQLANATAVVVNVTVTGPTAAGYVVV